MERERATEPARWTIAHRFPDIRSALQAYEAIRDLLLTDDVDASVFRFTLSGKSYVALLGEARPEAALAEKIGSLMSAAAPAELPQAVEDHLHVRRRLFKQTNFEFLERRSRQL